MHSTNETDSAAITRESSENEEALRHRDNGSSKQRVEETDKEEEEEELDEFGRVKQRRQKFKSERGSTAREEGEYDNDEEEEDEEEDRYHRRRSYRSKDPSPRYSRSRSPSRHRHHHRRRSSSYDRHRSESESDEDEQYRHSHHHHHHSRRRQRSPYHRSGNGHHHHHRHGPQHLYDTAGRYIDTEFYPTKIYIGDLEGVTYDGLEHAFERYGSIREVKMVEGKDYAFVTYDESASALAAIKGMHGTLLGTRRIKVNRAKIPERNQVGFGNVPWTDEDGNLAKEEMRSYPASREMSPLYGPGEYNTPPPIGRALTSYDDL